MEACELEFRGILVCCLALKQSRYLAGSVPVLGSSGLALSTTGSRRMPIFFSYRRSWFGGVLERPTSGRELPTPAVCAAVSRFDGHS